MPIPISYSYRNLLARRLTTALTAGGMALVIFVFAAVLMLAEGLRRTLVATGSYDNVVVLRAGSETEVQSSIDRTQAGIIGAQPEIALDMEGRKMVADEAIILVNLTKREAKTPANVIIRGVQATSLPLRREVKLAAGRFPRPGSTEIMAGVQIARRFQGAGLGESLRFAMRTWQVVGIFDAGNTGFSSEIWGDVEQLLQAFRRTVYSSVVFRLQDPGAFLTVKSRLEGDPRLPVQVLREVDMYEAQSRRLATFIRLLGLVLTGIFSVGAILGAMVTMYAQVGARVAEIGTMRALGFQRHHILLAFLLESVLLGFLGWILGLLPASLLNFITLSTINWSSFAELSFKFTLTPGIMIKSLIFGLGMGLLGGLLPALKAARLPLLEALRTA
ncbi:MAG: FtsX-like permease family protein [Deltaproteobacteria bacterium]|nr:FtsX-like permease family protein [Deltaproteobacteria bacterium]